MTRARDLRSTATSFLAFSFLAVSQTFARSLPAIQEEGVLVAERIERRAEQSTLSAAIEIAPSQYWDGNDGPWSSFPLQIGTPAQNIRAFVSTATGTTISVGAQGCPVNYTEDCSNSRGFVFLTNESLTWIPNSIYNVGIETNLGLDIASDVGFDTVTLGWQGSGGPTEQHIVVFNEGGSAYWVGEFGVKPQPTNFTNFNDPQPAYLSQLRRNDTIPSLSYGYTAGNRYRLNKVFGSLVLGGYDQNRFDLNNSVNIDLYQDVARDLLVNIQAITTNTGSTTDLLPSGPITAFIDSTIAQLWLPISACEAFEAAFGLTYDEDAQFYLVNSTLHQSLVELNPSVTFTLGASSIDGPTVDITLPYGAFDLELDFPNVENKTSYFPLKRAANSTQYTLGRTFLQEAYLIANYDNSTFTLAPCIWDQDKVSNSDIISIYPKNKSSSSSGGGSSPFPTGAVVGGIVGGAAALLLTFLLLLRRKRTQERTRLAELAAKNESDSLAATDSKPFISAPFGGELANDSEIHEMNAPYAPKAQEMESPWKNDPKKHGYAEMEAADRVAEMHGDSPIYEMQGSDVHEMPAREDVGRDEKR